MNEDVIMWLDDLEADLRKKVDRSDALDDLFQLSFTESGDVLGRVSWCLSKMAQNKCADMRIYDILMSMYTVVCDDVRENIAWGLGELAGSGIGTQDSLDALNEMMCSDSPSIRSSAAWAVGRYRHRLGLVDRRALHLLEGLRNDTSELVRKSADFAIGDDEFL